MGKEYSFAAWKDESKIDVVCTKLLDNANMDWDISPFPFSCTFTFFVIGSDIKVLFKCSEIEFFKLRKERDDEAMFVVLETHVRRVISEFSEQEIWSISIQPEAQIEIECNKFQWSIGQMTDSEKNM